APIDLCAFARSEMQLEIDGQLRGPDAADVVAQDGDAAVISLLPQALEDLLSAIGVAIQQPRDAWVEGIKEAAGEARAAALETRALQPTCQPSSAGGPTFWRSARSSGPGDHGSRGSCRTSRSRSRGWALGQGENIAPQS